jgi:hypothetical protein
MKGEGFGYYTLLDLGSGLDFNFRVEGRGLRVQGVGSKVKGAGFRIYDLQLTAWGLGFRV